MEKYIKVFMKDGNIFGFKNEEAEKILKGIDSHKVKFSAGSHYSVDDIIFIKEVPKHLFKPYDEYDYIDYEIAMNELKNIPNIISPEAAQEIERRKKMKEFENSFKKEKALYRLSLMSDVLNTMSKDLEDIIKSVN